METWDRILSLMAKTRVNSKELADIAGVVPSAVTKWKKGASIRSDALRRIAVHFGVSLDDLVGNTSVSTSGTVITRDQAIQWQGPDPPAGTSTERRSFDPATAEPQRLPLESLLPHAQAYAASAMRAANFYGEAGQLFGALLHLDQLCRGEGGRPDWHLSQIASILPRLVPPSHGADSAAPRHGADSDNNTHERK
jgi:DNA-binding Xre family transcriptional regulator